MRLNDYQTLANRTAKDLGENMDLMHVALGLAGEAGEFVDAVKRHLIYAKPLDVENAAEELGDSLWFIALGAKRLGISMEDLAKQNIEKLSKRYPEKYSDELAHARLDKA